LDELRGLKASGDGSILKSISDTIINRWVHDFQAKYLEAPEIKQMFTELTNKCTQNLKLVESVTEMCDKLNATSVKMAQYT
jgi:hypothetical protein